jgi:hypothetical protein
MPANPNHAQQPAAQAGEPRFLTVNMVMPAVGDSAKEDASFMGLLLELSALALERLSAAQENDDPDALREPVPSRLAGIPVDPIPAPSLAIWAGGNHI